MNNTTYTILISILAIVIIIGVGFIVWQLYAQNKAIKADVLLLKNEKEILAENKQQLEYENKQLKSDVDALIDTNQDMLLRIDQLAHAILQLETENLELQAEKENLEQSVEELRTKSSSTCTKNNSCKFRTPGSGFRCDADEAYNGSGEFWCECDPNCEVEVK